MMWEKRIDKETDRVLVISDEFIDDYDVEVALSQDGTRPRMGGHSTPPRRLPMRLTSDFRGAGAPIFSHNEHSPKNRLRSLADLRKIEEQSLEIACNQTCAKSQTPRTALSHREPGYLF